MGVGKSLGPGAARMEPAGRGARRGRGPELGALLQGAVPQAVRAGSGGGPARWECHFLAQVPGTFTASRGVFFEGVFPLLRREGELSGVRLPEAGVAESWGRPAAARRGDRPGGLPWVLRPARAVQSSDGLGRTKTQHPVSLAALTPSFSCLTSHCTDHPAQEMLEGS